MKIIRIAECGSTNAVAKGLECTDEPTLVVADRQTAGRGQKGNSWESEPGKNLTFSVVWRPACIPARCQFVISEAVALAVRDFLEDMGVRSLVKWPNDIYAGDGKICGILIEHSVTGAALDRTVAGIGVNVNQREFLSDAPNPVSLYNLLGKEHDLGELLGRLAGRLDSRIAALSDCTFREAVHREFIGNLWRGDGGYHPFRDVAENEFFEGKIINVEPEGPIEIIKIDGEIKKYQFKEVEFLLKTRF